MARAQIARKAKKTTGPRALGLVDLSGNGDARLIPVCIMMDGKFYDAGAYKASPVPFALWTGTVYEGEKTGVPQGLFTVAEAGHVGADIWFGQGKWVPAGSDSKSRAKKENDSKPKMEVDEGPPKLRRPEPDKPSDSSGQSTTPSSSSPPESKAPADGNSTSSTPDKPGSQEKPPAASNDEKKPADSAPTSSNDEDPNRPVLKRGKPETLGAERPQVGASTGVPRRPAGAAATSETKKVSSQLIPAISDAGGPDPRPYTYELKPAEEEKYRKGMLALASDAFAAKLRELTPAAAPAESATHKAVHHPPAKGPHPIFEDVQFRAFDLWNTNEPVFVLSATARVAKPSADDTSDQNYYVTIVAKNNIYDELRKLYAGITDARHLDQTPRMELIDAVDADGDGRGELLFRTTSDAGKAWAVYRAGADQLFPLFEGAPPENKPAKSGASPE